MIIYHVPEADAGERWLPTQAQANACAKAYKAEPKMVHAGEDGRDGMCAMLNSAEQQMAERLTGDDAAPMTREEIINSNTPEAQAAARELMNPDRERSFDASAIEEFILDRATVAQTERIMAALGTRFAELLKEKRNG